MDFIHWLQSFSSPAADTFWGAVTDMMSEDVFLTLIPVIFWCVDAWKGWFFANLMVASIFVNEGLKAATNMPRPTSDQVRVLREDTVSGSAFPSGHTQYAVAFWGYLAWWSRTWYMWVLAVVLIVLIGLSRLYLGLHLPQDVIGGALIGAALLALAMWVSRRWLPKAATDVSLWSGIAFVIVPAVIFFLLPNKTVAVAGGMAAGFNLGYLLILPRHIGTFPVRVGAGAQAIKIVIGIGGVLALRLGLKAFFPEELPFDFLRYTMVGLWVGWLAPFVFTLALRRTRAAAA